MAGDVPTSIPQKQPIYILTLHSFTRKHCTRTGKSSAKCTFIRTDNTYGPEPPLVERLERTVEAGEKTIIREVEEIEEEVEKVKDTEGNLLKRLAEGLKVIQEDEQYFLDKLSKEETDVLDTLKMDAEVEKLLGRALPIRKLR